MCRRAIVARTSRGGHEVDQLLDRPDEGRLEVAIGPYRGEEVTPESARVGNTERGAHSVLPGRPFRHPRPRVQADDSGADGLPHVDERCTGHEHVGVAHRGGESGLLAAAHEVVDEDAQSPTRPGAERAYRVGEMVDAVETCDDNTLDPQVVPPDALDQLGVVEALPADSSRPCDPRPCALHRT